jgi:hypothetical protein
MSNLLLAYNNRADGAALTAGDWSASLPRDNVKDGDISLVARTANAARASTRFRADLGASYTLQALALVNHNFSTAATWRVRLGTAPLDLDFGIEALDERLTFSGGAGGTRVNSAGTLVAATCPRIDYDPVTLACKGLLIEEQRTNIATLSTAPASWTQAGVSQDGTVTAPDGTSVPIWLASGVAEIHRLTRSGLAGGAAGNTLHAAGVYVHLPAGHDVSRLWLRARSGSNGNTVQFNVTGEGESAVITFAASGPFGAVPPAALTASDCFITNAGGGWWRIGFVGYTSGDASVATTIDAGFSDTTAETSVGTANTRAAFWQFDLTQGSFITSPIFTGAAALTRTVDVARISGAVFTGFYSQTEGTAYAEYSVARDSTASIFPCAVSLSDGTANNRMIMYTGPAAGDGTYASSVVGGATQASLSVIPSMVYGSFTKTAWAYKANDFGYCAAGSAVSTDTSGTVPTVSQLDIGARENGGSVVNGHIKRLTYWPTRLTNAQLQSITTSGPDALGFNSGFVNVKQLTFHGDTPSDWGAQYAAIAALPAAISARYATVEIDDTANAAGHLDIGRLFVGGGLQPAYNASYGGFADEREDLSTVVANPNGKRFGTARRRPRGVRFALQYTSQAEADRIHEMQAAVGTLDEVLYVPDPADAAHSQRYGFLGHLRQLSPIEYPFVLKRSIGFEIGEKL